MGRTLSLFPSRWGLIHDSQLVTAAIIGYLVWHDVPNWNLIAGAVIITGSGLLIAREAQRGQQQAQTVTP